MLTDQEKQLIARGYGQLGQHLPRFTPRPQQQAMIKRVASLFADARVGLIEAPTGIGKSFSYLIPSLILALTRDKRLVVSTATTSLQDQLASKDLPVVLDICEDLGLGRPAFSVAKGRERHVCPVKLEAMSAQTDMFENKTLVAEFRKLSDLFDAGQWSGLRDHILGGIGSSIWSKIANTSDSCTGDACPSRDDCPYYATVDATASARVIVTNHDYLLATLIHVPNSPLSQTDENLYVFDEAHHLGDKCLSAFAKSYDLLEDWQDLYRQAARMLHMPADMIDVSLGRLSGVNRAIEASASLMLGDGSQHRFVLGDAPTSLLELVFQAKGCLLELMDQMSAWQERSKDSKSALSNAISIKVNGVKGDIARQIDCLDSFANVDVPRARWITRHRTGIELRCSPFDASSIARQHLWPKITSAVLTSATLGSLGKFDATVRALGLPAQTSCMRLDSPLDYSRASLVVPRLALEGGDQGHSAMVSAFVKRAAFGTSTRLGVLIYFTSRTSMRRVYESLSDADKQIVLMQGDLHPSAMVAAHRERIAAGQRSVMFGLDSLSEGLDLPGENCTRVIIDRLPFPSLDDPIIATHAEHLKKNGFEPFPMLSLPKAGTKFAQLVGRLIRADGDYGDIIILDQRLLSKQYGAQLLAGTPFRHVHSAIQPPG